MKLRASCHVSHFLFSLLLCRPLSPPPRLRLPPSTPGHTSQLASRFHYFTPLPDATYFPLHIPRKLYCSNGSLLRAPALVASIVKRTQILSRPRSDAPRKSASTRAVHGYTAMTFFYLFIYFARASSGRSAPMTLVVFHGDVCVDPSIDRCACVLVLMRAFRLLPCPVI